MTINKKLLFGLFFVVLCLCCVFIVAGVTNKNEIVAKAETSANLIEEYSVPINEANFVAEETVINTANDTTFSEISPVLSGNVYVEGNLQWIDDDYKFHPLREVMINLYDTTNNYLELIDTFYTDDLGEFSSEFFIENGSSIILRVYAGDENVMVKNSSGLEYYYDFAEEINIVAGQTYSYNYSVNMSTNLGKAFQISQAVITARDFAYEMMGSIPSPVTVFFPSSDHAYYYTDSKTIRITDKVGEDTNYPHSYASWDLIMHEYGHHIQYELGIIDSPGGNHSSSQNDADIQKSKDKGIRIAWAESWPTVFGIIAQQYYADKLNNIQTVGDTKYTAYNHLNYDIETTTVSLGEACERSIMAVLWDLYDSDNEANDTIALGYRGFWDVTTKEGNITFSDFIKVFYNTYPNLINDIGANLSDYQMASYNLIITNNSLDTLPEFSWNMGGGSIRYPNNKVVLKFYDSNEDLIFSINITDNNYNLKYYQWNQILSAEGNYFYWRVETENSYENITTGPYFTQLQQVSKPVNVVKISMTKPLQVAVTTKNEYRWFKFKAPTSGTFTFYTEGNSDTYVELYKELYNDSEHNYFIGDDDNSGAMDNFKITYKLNYNDYVYLKITVLLPYFNYNIRISLDEHFHYYGECEFYDGNYHRYYCDCGEYIEEAHNYIQIGIDKVRCLGCMNTIIGSLPGGGILSVGQEIDYFNFPFGKKEKYIAKS